MTGSSRKTVPVVLTIAGSDSGGGAGIQADLKTFFRFGTFGTSAVTAITAQNSIGVAAWEAVSPTMVRAQIDTLVADLRPAALKSGMLANADIIATVAGAIVDHGLGPYVLDPVMVSTSGDRLLAAEAVDAIRRTLVPLATLVTPNLDETEILVGSTVRDVFTMKSAAEVLVRQYGARAALVKGGHLEGDLMVDVLFVDGEVKVFTHARLDTTSTHGTGCTLSSAITAQLAMDVPLVDAVRAALEYVHEAIRTAPGLGGGHGPLNHWAHT